jgi:hypothetical protein
MILVEVEHFITEVKTIPEKIENGPLKEGKVLLIDATKQFQRVVEKNANLIQVS